MINTVPVSPSPWQKPTLRTSVYDKDGITGARFTLLSEQPKQMNKIYGNNGFQDARYQEMPKNTDHWETGNKVNPMIASAYSFEKVFRPQTT